jgi:arylsulfatase A
VTSAKLTGARLPADREIDGIDLSALLMQTGPAPPRVLFYYWDNELRAVRKGAYKALLITGGAYGEGEPRKEHTPPLLFNLTNDAAQHPDIVADLLREVDAHRRSLKPGPPLFDERLSTRQKQ